MNELRSYRKKFMLGLIIISVALTSCYPNIEVFIRNFGSSPIRLEGKVIDRRYLDILPHRIRIYDTASKRKHMTGWWKKEKLVTWVDTANFYIDIPPYSVISLDEMDKHPGLYGQITGLILTINHDNKIDTVSYGAFGKVSTIMNERLKFGPHVIYWADFK